MAVVGVFITRQINQKRYFNKSKVKGLYDLSFDLRNPEAYPLDSVEGVAVTRIEGEHMAGFLLKANRRTRPGITVAYGGFEGEAGWSIAVGKAKRGQEALALFFFGQPNQPPSIDQVPLDHFQEVIDWVDKNAESSKPLIVTGGSKGAEYVANLLPRYAEIDHAILMAPSSYSFPALGGQKDHSSWTYQGQSVPYVSWEAGHGVARMALLSEIWKFWLKLPVSFTPAYQKLLDYAPEEARIRIEDSKATVLAIAGDADAMWPAVTMAKQLQEAAPDKVKVTVYHGVGHSPGVQRYGLRV